MASRPRAVLAAVALTLAGLTGAVAENQPPAPDASTPADPPGPAPSAAPAPERPPLPPTAGDGPPPSTEVQDAICLMIEASALTYGVPVAFFTRLIGQESSFRPDAVGPVTRSGAQAKGIAQFMPSTAAERGLLDPFDPVQALPRSAEFLRDLKAQFGNWGLAAAAYNAGPRRVADWAGGRGGLPFETQSYVAAITGRVAEEWLAEAQQTGPRPPGEKIPPATANGPALDDGNCETVRTAMRSGRRSPYLAALERRVVEGVAQPWGVQISGGFSRARALASFSRTEGRFGAVLGGADPMILRSLNRSRGTRAFYQVRIGQPSRQEAEALCARLHAAGGACVVLRNGPAARRGRSGTG